MSFAALRGSVSAAAIFSAGTARPWVWRSTRLAPGLTLSNGSRTMTNVSAGDNTFLGVVTDRMLTPNSPPVYWEMQIGARGAGANIGHLGVASVQVDWSYDTSILSSRYVSLREDGSIWDSGVQKFAANASRAYTTGDVIGIAFCPATGEIWFSKNGSWVFTSPRVPGYGGQHRARPATGWYPFLQNRDQGDAATLRSVVSQFSHPVPAGFVPLSEAGGLRYDFIPVPFFNSGFETGTAAGWTVTTGSLTVQTVSSAFTDGASAQTADPTVFFQEVALPPSAHDVIDTGGAYALVTASVVQSAVDPVQHFFFEPVYIDGRDRVISSDSVGFTFAYSPSAVGDVRTNIPAGTRKIRLRFRHDRTTSFQFYVDNIKFGVLGLRGMAVYGAKAHAVLGKPKDNIGVRHATLHAIIVP